jgi:hypothetical protein
LVQLLCNYPNVRYFIHQIGGRHGFPYHVNKKVFEIYLEPYQDKVVIEKMNSSIRVLDHIDNIDKVIMIRGAESAEPLSQSEGKRMYLDMKKRYSYLGKQLRKRGVGLDFLFVDRPLAGSLSATKFTEIVQRYHSDKKTVLDKSRPFVPEHVSYEDYKYIVRKMCQSFRQ